jgi:8-oxo-dGTP diphosphatase
LWLPPTKRLPLFLPPMTMRVAVDIVLFGYAEQQLHLLLIRRKYAPIAWALPGGFVLEDEDLETAVARELREEAGVANVYLEQLYTFGAVARDPRRRVISVAYYGLVKPEQFTLSATTDSLEAKWFRRETLPELAFDHADIIEVAHQRLRARPRTGPAKFSEEDTFLRHRGGIWREAAERGAPSGQPIPVQQAAVRGDGEVGILF